MEYENKKTLKPADEALRPQVGAGWGAPVQTAAQQLQQTSQTVETTTHAGPDSGAQFAHGHWQLHSHRF